MNANFYFQGQRNSGFASYVNYIPVKSIKMGTKEVMNFSNCKLNYFTYKDRKDLQKFSFFKTTLNYCDNNNCLGLSYNVLDVDGEVVIQSNANNIYFNKDISNLFQSCDNLKELFSVEPESFKYVTNMRRTYYACSKLTGSPICGPNVTDMYKAYENCWSLTGSPACEDKVTTMFMTYYNCYNLNDFPVCGNNVTNMSSTYYNCRSLIGSPVCKDNVNNMSSTYRNCYSLTGSPVCGPKVINMSCTYYNCCNLKGSPVCESNVTNMYMTYRNCYNLTGSPVCEDSVTDMCGTYYNCRSLTGDAIIGPNVQNCSETYRNCSSLDGNIIPGNQEKIISSMNFTYFNCVKLKGQPWGQQIKDLPFMLFTYTNCKQLTGSPVCSNSVQYFTGTYYNCYRLTGNAIFGENIIDYSEEIAGLKEPFSTKINSLEYSYYNCSNLDGNLESYLGTKEKDYFNSIQYLLYNCFKLKGNFNFSATKDMKYTYYNCTNLKGDICLPSDYSQTEFEGVYCNCFGVTGTLPFNSAIPTDKSLFQSFRECYQLEGEPLLCVNNNMAYAYYNCGKINKINFKPTTTIDSEFNGFEYAFYNCSNLNGNFMPSSGIKIECESMAYSFYNCHEINSINLNPNNCNNAAYAFYDCYKMKTNVVLNNQNNIAFAFYNCQNYLGGPSTPAYLNFSYEESLSTLDCNSTFYNCIGIAKNIIINRNITNANSMFYGCNKIPNIYFRRDYCYVDQTESAFENMSSLKTFNTSKKNVMVELNNRTFYYCNLLKNINNIVFVPKDSIKNAFYYCDNILQINLKAWFLPQISSSWDNAFAHCHNLQEIYINQNEDTMYDTYDHVIDMNKAFYNCSSLKSFIYQRDAITDSFYTEEEVRAFEYVRELKDTFSGCTNLIEAPFDQTCPYKVINLINTYCDCYSLVGAFKRDDDYVGLEDSLCGPDVINMYSAYQNCHNLTGSPACGPKVTNMAHAYYNCNKLTGSPVCGDNVTNMSHTYFDCSKLTGSPVCGPKVTNMYCTYYNCRKLTGSPVCEPNVTDMSHAYEACSNLNGSPICRAITINMSFAYYDCYNLTGSPVCGPNVTDMSYAYSHCHSLTGSPVCRDNVTNMRRTYLDCYNLKGSPVCGPNVTDMSYAYHNCHKLTGEPKIGSKVVNLAEAYTYCNSLSYSSAITIPASVQNLNNAFYFCSKILRIIFPNKFYSTENIQQVLCRDANIVKIKNSSGTAKSQYPRIVIFRNLQQWKNLNQSTSAHKQNRMIIFGEEANCTFQIEKQAQSGTSAISGLRWDERLTVYDYVNGRDLALYYCPV